jgi:protein ImuB
VTSKPSANRQGRRYLALWFALLPAERWFIHQPQDGAGRDDPLAFVEKRGGAIRLVAVDARARALGMAPGLTLADARARVPELAVVDQDSAADQAWLERLADGCLRYTPQVAIDAPDGLTLDISGCAHLFGGEAALADALVERLGRLGMSARHAIAATPDAARALARFQTAPGQDEAAAVRRLPVAALQLDTERTTALIRAGLKTIGEVARRPMAGIAARFGSDAVQALHRLTGDSDSPIDPHRITPAILVERRFPEPIAQADYALRIVEELAGEAADVLARRDQGGRRFEALFFRSDGLVQRLRVETGMATRDPPAVMRLFRERIAALSDPIDPGFGYDLIRLAVPGTEALAATQLKLEGGTVAEAEIAALVDRLSTRLGKGRIRRFRPVDSHIPEQAQLLFPAIEGGEAVAWPMPETGEPPSRPLHLFDPPHAIEAIAEVPDGPPLRFRWRRSLHDITRYEGPERIASEWWRRRDGRGLTRDYYRVEDRGGRRFWIFRHGLYEGERAAPGWYLHGLFA